MKRIAAILLSGMLFFNWYGYQILSHWLEVKADHQLEARLDAANYDESQLLDLKIPSTHLSYYNSSTTFERVDGQIEIGGIKYQYVKRRLFNDTLELLCIPNHAATHQQIARNEFFKVVNDIQQPGGQSKKAGNHTVSKVFSSDDYMVNGQIQLDGRYFTQMQAQPHAPAPSLITSYFSVAGQPPDSRSI